MPFKKGETPKGAIPFKKGQSGNPNGAPKKPDLSEALNLLLSEEKDGIKALDAMLRTLRAKAIKGDIRAIQELLDRTYGKSKQSMDVTTAGKPISASLATKSTSELMNELKALENGNENRNSK